MPKPTSFHPSAVSGLLQIVAAALAEERKSIAVYLEERHASLLTDLKRNVHPPSHVPDDGPEVFPQEPLVSARVERQASDSLKSVQQKHKDLSTSTKQERESLSSVTVAQQAAKSLHACSREVDIAHLVAPQVQTKAQAKSQMLQDSFFRLPDSPVQAHGSGRQISPHRQENSICHMRSVPSRTKKAAIQVAGERINREAVTRRLYAKLGYIPMGEWLAARDLHTCLESLTLETFDVDEMVQLVLAMQSQFTQQAGSQVLDASSTRDSGASKVSVFSGVSVFSRVSRLSRASSLQSLKILAKDVGIQFHKFVDILCMDATELQVHFDEDVLEQIGIIRDVLLATDANSMIAELMHLRVDEIAAPEQKPTYLDYLEPVIGGVILLNGLLIGLQTVPEIAEHPSMLVADICMTFLFIIEFVTKLRYNGFVKHFIGPESHWNWFDLSIILLALVDVALNIATVNFDTSAMTIMRMARLTRLARLVRIFRVSWLSELSLVCKGLIGGLRTLFWAVVLLFLILYVVGVFLTITIGQPVAQGEDELYFEDALSEHFSTLPRAAFTTFRCLLIVECTAESGRPILVMATNKYGWVVPVFYIFLFVTVSIGLMNLIMAIYIESTLQEAKNEKESNQEARHRQSLRVALQLKRLLLKISKLQAGHHRNMKDSEVAALMKMDSGRALTRRTIDPNLEITKEVFLMAVQNAEIQKLMNDLGIPPERAHLFDVLDADGSGHLKPRELLNGLLKVRGESRKSDSAALLLAVRCLQTSLTTLETHIGERHNELLEFLTNSTTGIETQHLDSS